MDIWAPFGYLLLNMRECMLKLDLMIIKATFKATYEKAIYVSIVDLTT